MRQICRSYFFICLFNDAVNSLNKINSASTESEFSEQQTGKDVEGHGRGLI
jgi:hypothetical protein